MLVFGSINLDLTFLLPRLPGAGETQLGRDVSTGPGGKGANQALAARLDGADVILAGAVGRDAFADPALARLAAAGVDISRVAQLDASTGVAAICVDPRGRNQIAVASGANALARADQVEDALLTPGAWLLVQMECDAGQTAALIHRAHRRRVRIVLNLAPAATLPDDALRLVDVLIVNEHEAAWLGGADAAALHATLGVAVVCTLGERGAEFCTGAEHGRIASRRVAVVDTTGAGDCFAGVLTAQLERGCTMEAAVERAGVAAALACTRPGAQESFPNAEQTTEAAGGGLLA